MSATQLAREWIAAFEPAPDLRVSEWAEQHRRLPEVSAARGGRWRNDVTPYLRGVMDATIERGVRQIAVCKAAQCGASEALLNIVLFHIHARPCPMLMLLPTASAAAAWSKERLADALRSMPELRRLVSDKRLPSAEGRPESTLSFKLFAGGFLALGGGNSRTVTPGGPCVWRLPTIAIAFHGSSAPRATRRNC
jgi:phage terminase large subunit GpA-like protein